MIKSVEVYYEPGDKIWITLHPVSKAINKKLMPRREGPYILVTNRSPTTYDVTDPDRVLGTYANMMKPYNLLSSKNRKQVAFLRKRGRPRKSS